LDHLFNDNLKTITMTKSLLASWQMYKKTRIHTTYFKYVSITKDSVLLGQLDKLSPKAQRVLQMQILKQMNRANNINEDNLVSLLIVELDLTDYTRQYKNRILKELKDINLISKVEGDTYVVNVAYINPFNDSQTREFVKQMMLTDIR